MNKYLAGTLTVLFWIVWPIYIVLYYLAITIFAILKVLYWPIAFVLQPVVYLLRFIAACLALPFRALVKLEPLYNYLGVAALVGLLGGLALFYTYNIFHRLLRLDSVAQPPREQRTARQYREEKARYKARSEPHLLSPQSNGNGMVVNLPNGLGSASARRGGNRNLLDQTIMEEMDSDY